MAPARLQVDGRAVAHLEAGGTPEDGAPLLLLHGFTGSKEDFASVISELARHRRVVAVDLPGHGGSAGPDDPAGYAQAAVAGWVLDCADALGLGEFHLLGHSMGGLIAQRVAARASQRLCSLVLMDTGVGAPREEVCDIAAAIAMAVQTSGLEAGFEVSRAAAAQGRAHLDIEIDRAEFVRRRFLALNPAAVIGEARALIRATPLQAFLKAVDVPVLVAYGEHDDVWTPSEQAQLVRAVGGAREAVITGARHSPQLENTAAWLEAVDGFLAEVDGRARAQEAGA